MGELGSQKDGVSREEPDSSGDEEEERYYPIYKSERTRRTQEKEKRKSIKE